MALMQIVDESGRPIRGARVLADGQPLNIKNVGPGILQKTLLTNVDGSTVGADPDALTEAIPELPEESNLPVMRQTFGFEGVFTGASGQIAIAQDNQTWVDPAFLRGAAVPGSASGASDSLKKRIMIAFGAEVEIFVSPGDDVTKLQQMFSSLGIYAKTATEADRRQEIYQSLAGGVGTTFDAVSVSTTAVTTTSGYFAKTGEMIRFQKPIVTYLDGSDTFSVIVSRALASFTSKFRLKVDAAVFPWSFPNTRPLIRACGQESPMIRRSYRRTRG